MAVTTDVVGTHHGPGCRCHPMDPITATVTPVIINPSCPVQREVPRPSEIVGRIAITWPAAGDGPCAPTLPVWPIQLHDVDTGRPLTNAVAMHVNADVRNDKHGVVADLTQYVDSDGNPANTWELAHDDDGSLRTAVFRYAVIRMNNHDPGPAETQLPSRTQGGDSAME